MVDSLIFCEPSVYLRVAAKCLIILNKVKETKKRAHKIARLQTFIIRLLEMYKHSCPPLPRPYCKLPERGGAGRESRGHTGRCSTKTGNVQPLLHDGGCGRVDVKLYLDFRSSPSTPGVKAKTSPLPPASPLRYTFSYSALLLLSIRVVFLAVSVFK